jgi:hypothetical protein
MREILALAAMLLMLLLTSEIPAQSFTAENFKQFTDMRVGTGEPIYWYCIGEIYEYPGGKLVARVEGVDTARRVKDQSEANKVLQISRKIFFYRNPKTNEIIRELDGKKVEPIAYPYQKITYELRDGHMVASVVQGRAQRVQQIESSGLFYVRQMGGNLVFSSPLFLNLGNYNAYENYDFFYAPKAKSNRTRYQLTWNRRGSLPPAFGGGDSVFQLVSYRVDKYYELPKTMRDALESDGPMWMSPPKDLAEIAELQK